MNHGGFAAAIKFKRFWRDFVEHATHHHSKEERRNGARLRHALKNGAPQAAEREAYTQVPVWSSLEESQVSKEVRILIEQAHAAMREGRVDDGERLFRKVLEYGVFPAVINNLALLQLDRHNQPEAALWLLQQNLQTCDLPWQPFTRALAARCLSRLNQHEKARRTLQEAIDDFEAGFSALATAPAQERRAWQEYTTKILEAAGELGDDQLVWTLYRRWARLHVLASSHFCGGIAAFNLRRFRSAANTWRRARELHGWMIRAFETVASWCERGLVEPFSLQYDFEPPDSPVYLLMHLAANGEGGAEGDDSMFNASLIDYLRRPANRIFIVWVTFRPLLSSEFPEERGREATLEGVSCIIRAGGDWGEAFAQRLFDSPAVEFDVKGAALRGLVLAGRVAEQGSIRMWVDGKVRKIPLKDGQVQFKSWSPD